MGFLWILIWHESLLTTITQLPGHIWYETCPLQSSCLRAVEGAEWRLSFAALVSSIIIPSTKNLPSPPHFFRRQFPAPLLMAFTWSQLEGVLPFSPPCVSNSSSSFSLSICQSLCSPRTSSFHPLLALYHTNLPFALQLLELSGAELTEFFSLVINILEGDLFKRMLSQHCSCSQPS